ncbi:MAG: galactose-1-phosphate uridylyltransferase [bacterium]
MPVLRQDLTTRSWTIIATERAKRPHDFTRDEKANQQLPQFDRDCPFCPGNEHMAPPEVFSIVDKQSGQWKIRVVPNKFPALVRSTSFGEKVRKRNGPYLEMAGEGIHEVVIECPDHSETIATMELNQVELVVKTYRERFLDIDSCASNQLIIIFRNQGERAGTSLLHPHSQIVATPIVPVDIRRRLEEAQRYYDDNGTCVYCDIIDYETSIGERMVQSNDGFVVICPFASIVPFEMWIVPRKHESSFGELGDDEIPLLADVLKGSLHSLHRLLGNPDYNYVVRSAPHYTAGEPHFHWHIQILPRLTKRAGFEIGSGMTINITPPEQAAQSLRQLEEA